MARKQNSDGPSARKPRRKGNPVGARIDDRLHGALVKYQESHAYPPDNQQVIVRALQELLEREGFYKPE